MKDYLLKREAELIAASEALDVAHDKAWKKGQTDIATAHVVGGSTVLARLKEVQDALKFLNGGQSK